LDYLEEYLEEEERVVSVQVEVLRLSKNGVNVSNGKVNVWLPLKDIYSGSSLVEGISSKIIIPEWLAQNKGLEGEYDD